MRLALLAVAVSLGACSGSSTPDAGNAVDSGYIDCTNDPRVATYAPGMSVADDAADRSYALMSIQPTPPARGTNTWTVKVTDGTGASVSGLSLGAAAFMPDHGHGSDVVPQVTSNGDGTYAITPLYFFMPGVWRITLSDADGGAHDAQFFFCVEG
jgi:hypothetical protein